MNNSIYPFKHNTEPMIISKKYNYTQIFLKMLCPAEDYYQLIEDARHYLQFNFIEEHIADGVSEVELEIDDTVIVMQYHPHLGIHLYLNDMEDARPDSEEILLEVAKKMEQII